MTFILNHRVDAKYSTIIKKCTNLLHNNQKNGRSYHLETNVSNHCQEVQYIQEFATNITTSVPDQAQRVEYLIDSILCLDNTLQSEIRMVRANTNNTRNNFEAAESKLIEVYPYKKDQIIPPATGKKANISDCEFSGGRGSSGVDLHWNHPKEFNKLYKDQKYELFDWIHSN